MTAVPDQLNLSTQSDPDDPDLRVPPAERSGPQQDPATHRYPDDGSDADDSDTDELGPGLEPIAIVGMAARVPGASDVETLWSNLLDGVEAKTRFSLDEQRALGMSDDDVDDEEFVPEAFVLQHHDELDAALFGMTPREASMADPGQRLMLELAHTALHHAGIDPAHFAGDIGVYCGGAGTQYLWRNVKANASVLAGAGELGAAIGNGQDYLSTNISYKLGLTGPSMTVVTACSTSLVTTHLACEALRNHECDAVITGGVSIELPQGAGYISEHDFTSPTGQVRAFDAGAAGTVWGSGGGAVVLRRLSDAVRDGDTVHAVILGNAVNNDGATKVGFSAPSVQGQVSVIRQALQVAGISPRSIGYVEAHGTGTSLGDPIEVQSLTTAYGEELAAERAAEDPTASTDTTFAPQDRQWCAIGSVKSNLGHLSQAAGVISLIKAAMVLRTATVPPTLHFEKPNPAIDFESGPFYPAASLGAFPAVDGPRRAAVSSFGIGGTNAHVILEQAPDPARAAAAPQEGPASSRTQVLPLSANTDTALAATATRLAAHLRAHPELDLADVARTLRTGRISYSRRSAVIAADSGDAIAQLAAGPKLIGGAGTPRLGILFSGQGSQFPGMGRALYSRSVEYAAAIDECSDVLRPILGLDLRELMLVDPADTESAAPAAQALTQTFITQPALFTVEYALARFWTAAGARPAVLIGHSIGEYAAAVTAGIFPLHAALELVATRGRLMHSMPRGVMMAVQLPADEVRPLLTDGVEIAGVNGPRMTVVGGTAEAIEAFADTLPTKASGARLRTSHAFHTAAMDPILDEFAAAVATAGPVAPQLDIISGLTGELLTAEQATDPRYWARQLREPVLFGAAVATALAAGDVQFLECGPGRQLAGLARMQTGRGPAPQYSLAGPGDTETDLDIIGRSWARLWVDGNDLDLPTAPVGRRVALPTYPYERRRHWIDPSPLVAGSAGPGAAPVVHRGPARVIEDWFAVPTFRELPPLSAAAAAAPVLVIGSGARADRIVAALRVGGTEVLPLDTDAAGVAAAVFAAGPAAGPAAPSGITDRTAGAVRLVHLRALDCPPDELLEQGFHDLLAILQALAELPEPPTVALTVLTPPVAPVTGGEDIVAQAALVAGPVRVGALELPFLRTRWIDVDGRSRDSAVAREVLGAGEPREVSLRSDRRWVKEFTQTRPTAQQPGFRDGGRYLITGGTGGLGVSVAAELASRYRGRLALLARTPLPPRESWPAPGAERIGEDRTARTIAAVRAMEDAGAEVRVIAADVTDPAALAAVSAELVEAWGGLDGIVHAAGVAGGGMIEVKDPAVADSVLAPKVAGTLALRTAFADVPLELVVLCSSITALAGDIGQVDYCSGNAFLDAVAASAGWSGPVVSVNWGGWSEIGMAVETVSVPGGAVSGDLLVPGTTSAAPVVRLMDHPLLTRCDGVSAEGEISAETHWVLDQHRIGDVPVLPGTGMIEAIVAAHRACFPDAAGVSIADLAFLAPLRVPDGAAATLRVEFGTEPGAEAATGERVVTVLRTLDGVTTRHAQASVTATTERAGALDPEALLAGVLEKDATASGLFRGQSRTSVVTFGPRWDVLRRHWMGPGMEVAELVAVPGVTVPGVTVPGVTVPDLTVAGRDASGEGWHLHPALLDVATAFSERGDGAYLPIGYGEVTVFAPLPAEFLSVLRYSGEPGEVVAADLDLIAPDGRILVRIRDFALRRIDPEAVTAGDRGSDGQLSAAEPELDTAPHRVVSGTAGIRIATADGVTAFRLLASSGLGPQVVINPMSVAELLDRVRSGGTDPEEIVETADGPVPSGSGTVATIAAVWSAVLGVPDVAAEDDFFALGGNSLVAVQLIGQIRKAVGVRLPMRIIFDAPTVQEMADQVDAMRAAADATGPSTASESSEPSAASARPAADAGKVGNAEQQPNPAIDGAGQEDGSIPRLVRPGR